MKNTDLQLPPIEDELGTTGQPQSNKPSGSKPPLPKKPAEITDPNERKAMEMARGGAIPDDDDWFQKEQPSNKPIVAAQKSSRGRLWALLVALGVVATGATIYWHSNGEDGDSAKGEKPSADATTKPDEPKCRFNYDSSVLRVIEECEGIAASASKIEFDADKSTAKNAVGRLLIDTDGNGKFDDTADVSCGITLLRPADRTKSQQLDVVGGLECAPKK